MINNLLNNLHIIKKVMLSACAILVASATFAQTQIASLPNDGQIKGTTSLSVAPIVTAVAGAAAPIVIWSDDCSSASTWIFTNTSTLGFDWAIEMDPYATPAGGALTPMASASAANGFMFISSDANGGPDGDGTTIECEFTNATPIDLSMYPNVQLTFEHNFRWWNDTRIVRISGDNGATWTDVDEITNNSGYTYPNQSSDNPHMSTYDISSVAGGQSQVLVQFYYNDHDIWAWYWAVDDIAISELPDNNIVSSEEVMGGWWIAYQAVGGLGQDYTYYPMTQATAVPYTFESVVRNEGLATQEVIMNAVVLDASQTPVYMGTSNTITLAAAEQDTFAVTTTFSPSATGTYIVAMWSEADSLGAGITMTYTDTVVKVTTVTDYIYGKDQDTPDGAWRVSRNTGGFEVGSAFDIYANENLFSIDAHIADYSIPGAKIYAMLYEYDPAGDPVYLDQSDDYTITTNDVANGWINIPFLNTQSLFAGVTYVVSLGGYQHPTDTAGVSLSGLGVSVQYLFDMDDVYAAGQPTWYTISDIPMIRMNFDPETAWIPTAVNDVKNSQFNVYPNPTNGVFNVEFDAATTYEISVNNILGQTVYSSTINSMSTTIDLTAFDKGVYTIKMKNDLVTLTEKVIVE